ncbi:Uncharacterised protein [Mycobacterium tuberculosis]|uniref:Uncharacterized protein n=1 Tax=Mycobacterium tuberculosis TaxID=1773 RepID=A0A655JNG7_MYCTX|nr:Uncharacterised protein [Mycobacterium tuberculosis]
MGHPGPEHSGASPLGCPLGAGGSYGKSPASGRSVASPGSPTGGETAETAETDKSRSSGVSSSAERYRDHASSNWVREYPL